MRVIHVVPAIVDEASGPSYSVVRLCGSLIEQGFQVDLASLEWAPMRSSPSFLKTFSLGLGPRRLGRSPKMRRWLLEMAESQSAEIIHNHSLWMMPNIYPGHVARRSGIPLMNSPRGTLSEWAFGSGTALKKLFWPLIQRPALHSTSCFHATAESEHDDIRRMGFRQPIAIIPNGIDIPKLPPKGNLVNSQTLLFLGRIHPVKGLDILLPAWQAVQDRFPAWNLRIVGPDNRGYLSQMHQLARQLKLRRIEFSGPLHGDAKWLAYGKADLFVLPTYSENFGIAVAEALAAGTPAVVTKGAPWSGLTKQGAGWWIDIGVDSLVACLEEAMSRSASELAEMGYRGREWMTAEYSWVRISEQMAETYRWVVYGGTKPAWVIEN